MLITGICNEIFSQDSNSENSFQPGDFEAFANFLTSLRPDWFIILCKPLSYLNHDVYFPKHYFRPFPCFFSWGQHKLKELGNAAYQGVHF